MKRTPLKRRKAIARKPPRRLKSAKADAKYLARVRELPCIARCPFREACEICRPCSSHRKQDRTTEPELLLLDEVAQICRAPIDSVRFWVRTGKLRSVRPGRRRLVRRSDLAVFLERGGAVRGHEANAPMVDAVEDQFPTGIDDIIDESDARRIARCRSARTWQSWHDRGVILWFVPPGTNRRVYSRTWLLEWVRAGARGAVKQGEAWKQLRPIETDGEES